MTPRVIFAFPFIALFGAGCCGGGRPSSKPDVLSVASTQPALADAPDPSNKPFLVGEAGLPVGYPPPAEVGKVVYKIYPAVRVAVVRSADVKGDDNDLFRPLFDHVKKRHIDMTSPVQMRFDAAADGKTPGKPTAMELVYPAPSAGVTGTEGVVTVADAPPVNVLSVGTRGGYDRDTFAKGYALLRQWLDAHPGGYRVTGSPRFLGYNSPLVPGFLKYGEVQVPVDVVH